MLVRRARVADAQVVCHTQWKKCKILSFLERKSYERKASAKPSISAVGVVCRSATNKACTRYGTTRGDDDAMRTRGRREHKRQQQIMFWVYDNSTVQDSTVRDGGGVPLLVTRDGGEQDDLLAPPPIPFRLSSPPPRRRRRAWHPSFVRQR